MGEGPAEHWGPAHRWGAGRGASGWTVEEVRAFLGAYGRATRRLQVAELPGGWENLNLRIEADGERLVLRRYDATDPADVRWELALLRFLSRVRFPTPALIERADGEPAGTLIGRPAALFAFVGGRHPRWDDPGAAEQAAEVIAHLHAATAGLSLPYPRTRLDSRRRLGRFQSWVRDRGVAPAEDMLRRLAEDVARYGGEFAARLAAVEGAAGALPRGVVHHDAHGNNVLVDARGRLVALLDFDDAHETFLLADVAVLLDTWGTDRGTYRFDAGRAAGILRAYARRRPLGAAERALLPDVMALYNLADATSYVAGRLEKGTPANQAVADCGQYARFRECTAAPGWRERLRNALAT